MVIGLLMTLVLALGVQDICEALTITQTSSPVVSQPSGSSFELTFRVGLTGNTVQYHPDHSNRRIDANDHESPYQYIDSQGYEVTYPIEGSNTSYRNTTGIAESQITNGTFVVGKSPSYSDEAIQARPAATPYLVNTRGTLFDANGEAINIRTGAGTRKVGDTAADSYKYVSATFSNTTGISIAARPENSDLNDYNNEAINITTVRPDEAKGILKLKSPSYVFPSTQTDDIISVAADTPRDAVLQEGVDIGLPSSITLVYEGASVGTHKIVISDATPQLDFPVNAIRNDNRPRAIRTFTIHVTESTITDDVGTDDITPDSIRRPVVADEPQPVSDLFDFPMEGEVPKNYRIHYEVFRGNGILYVGTREQEFKTPSPGQTLLVHQDSNVWIKMNGTSNEVHLSFAGEDRSTARARVVYEYRGKDLPGRNTSDNAGNNAGNTVNNTISVSNTSLSGAPGTTSDITIGAGTATVRVQGSSGFTSAGGTVSGSGTVRTITLPRTAGNYFLTVSASGYTDRQISVTVEAPQALGTLTVSKDGAQTGLQQQILVRASSAPSRTVAFTVTRGGVRVGSGEILTTGSGRAIVSVPATGTYILTVSATGYTSRQVTFTAGAQTTTTTTDTTTPTTPTTTTTVSEPSSLQIAGQSTRSGTANTALDAPLLVRVLDDDGDAVAETRVIFRVRTGQGRLSERGNGRAIALQTDNSGYARAPYTPMSASSTVEAEASGVTRRVTFTITASGGAATPTTRDTDTGSDTISPVVHTAAAKRPPMLWVDNGAIYALVDTDVQRFAPTVDNALSLAIGGDTVYWTEKTGDSAGTINSANLDGTGIKELKAIMAVPMGITVDTTANLLYWTNSRGRIQSLNADGSGRVENVLQNLTSPLDIGLAGGNVYWTHSNGGIGFASLKGQKQVRNISNGADAAGSLVIGGGKVYWTEETGENGGRIKSANLNGSGITDVASIFAVPIGIGLDSSRGKLFWTNSRGRIQSSDLEGNGVSNVVDGLGSPGDMVLSNSIAAPAATTTTTTTADNAKYDVNGDGTVDNMDAGLVSEAMGTSNAKYDVNGDGTVNFLDLLLVFDNRDEGAASAPTVLGMQLSTVQVDVLQEQIDLLIATGDRSPAAMRTLIYLQQLIATARPEQTQLLANYPNPFNPETWIPYELATDTTVTLTIYNAQGVVVRTLQLGHQSAGYYVGRDRAAYWDGRNAFGEQVASGIYFYQLETDAMSLMRKMVILK